MRIPTGPNDLTADWLTEALRLTKTLDKAAVTAFDVAPLGEVEGITGQLARVRLSYDLAEADAPRTLIAKFSSENPAVIAIVKSVGMYEREVRFYQHVANKVGLRTPYSGSARATPALLRAIHCPSTAGY